MRSIALLVVAGCGFAPSPVSTQTTDAPRAGDAMCTPELCNGIDDDCDGIVDEGFTLGAPCDGSDADLCMDGHVVCSADGTTTVCDDDAASIVEVCNNNIDDDCNGFVDCQDAACCTGGACASSGYCCTGSELVHTIDNTCMTDYGSSSSSDNLEVYCCGGIARFCLSGETCPWRSGCASTTTTATCSRSGLSTDMMAVATCQKWQNIATYDCSAATSHEYFP